MLHLVSRDWQSKRQARLSVLAKIFAEPSAAIRRCEHIRGADRREELEHLGTPTVAETSQRQHSLEERARDRKYARLAVNGREGQLYLFAPCQYLWAADFHLL